MTFHPHSFGVLGQGSNWTLVINAIHLQYLSCPCLHWLSICSLLLLTMTPLPVVTDRHQPRLTFRLPSFYSSHRGDNQLQAGVNLTACCFSCTLLSFDFYLGLLRGLRVGHLWKPAWHSHCCSLTRSPSPTKTVLDFPLKEKKKVDKFRGSFYMASQKFLKAG